MTNMGCYAIDYAVALLDQPRAVQARGRLLGRVTARAGSRTSARSSSTTAASSPALGRHSNSMSRATHQLASIPVLNRNLLIEPHGETLIINGSSALADTCRVPAKAHSMSCCAGIPT